MTMIAMTLNIHIDDEAAFRAEAARIARRNMEDDDANLYLSEDEFSLGECAQMIFDPGVSPDGCTIQGGQTEVTDAGDKDEIIYLG